MSGKNQESNSRFSQDAILEVENGTQGKITLYRRPISTIDVFHYKIVIYFFSFLLKTFLNFFTKKMKNSKRLNKMIFYVIFYHQKLHFAFFNIFLANCVFLNGRSLIHTNFFGGNNFVLKIDKILNFFCFFFYWIDICEMVCIIIDYRIAPPEKAEPYNDLLKSAIKQKMGGEENEKIEKDTSSIELLSNEKTTRFSAELPKRLPCRYLSPLQAKILQY